MICVACHQYFKPNPFVSDCICPDCDGVANNFDVMDEELEVELGILTNPSGRVKAQIIEDREC